MGAAGYVTPSSDITKIDSEHGAKGNSRSVENDWTETSEK